MEDPSTVVKARKELAEKRHYAYKVRAEAATKIQTWYKSSKRNRIYSNQVKLQDEQLSTYHCEKENDYCSDTESNKLTDYSVDSEKFINGRFISKVNTDSEFPGFWKIRGGGGGGGGVCRSS